MKKLLFLYPIEEYMKFAFGNNPELFLLLNEIINKRYRQKGYQIILATFKNKSIFGIDLLGGDKIIQADITFEEHTTPIAQDEDGENVYRYPNIEKYGEQIGDFEELVVCGFHVSDCVMKVAEYFYDKNNSTIVDEELTDFLRSLSKRFYFDSSTYNLANRLMYDKAEDRLMYGEDFVINLSHYRERYSKPYFHTERFVSDFTLEECMSILIEIERKRQESRAK